MSLSNHDFYKIKKYLDVLSEQKAYCVRKMWFDVAINLRDVEVKYFTTHGQKIDNSFNREINLEAVYDRFEDFEYEQFCEDLLFAIIKTSNVTHIRDVNIYLTLNENPYCLTNIKKFLNEMR